MSFVNSIIILKLISVATVKFGPRVKALYFIPFILSSFVAECESVSHLVRLNSLFEM